MQKTTKVLIILFLFLGGSTLSFAVNKKSSTLTYLEELHNQGKERVIITFKDTPDIRIVNKYNAKLIHELKIINAVVCEVDKSKIELLKQEMGVVTVFPDAIITIPRPEEREVSEQEITPLVYDGNAPVRWNNLAAGVNSQAAWDNYDLDGTGIKVAIIDSGINYTLENLDDNYLGGYDFVDDDSDPLTIDPLEKHGTYVASVLLGEGVNKIVGVAYNASYYALRIIEGENPFWVSDAMAAIDWAADPAHKADIISMSIRSVGLEPGLRLAYEVTCDAAYSAGIVLIAGSGNDSYSYSGDPAAFNSVISVGAHAEDQTIPSWSNGDVDIIAPGVSVASVRPDNSGWFVSGTSMATPHVSGIAALLLQYARVNNLKINNGYVCEALRYSAVDLGIDPNYQGKGKAWAAGSDTNDPNIGAIDLIASDWPIDYEFTFTDYAFIDANLPVYQIGQDVNQTIELTNLTDILGNTDETIQNLQVTVTHVYPGQPNEPNLPGASIKVFPTTTLEPNEANSITLSYIYTIPEATTPGLKKTKIEFEFNFVGNSRVMKIAYNEPNNCLWYASIPADLDLEDDVDLTDYSLFSQRWGETDCNVPNWCNRADIDQTGDVDWSDLGVIVDNWLRGF